MKKLIALILTSLMMVSAAAADEFISGLWTPSDDPAVTEERQALFEKGTAALTGAEYIPIAYLGSQIVAGMNHAFLCRAIPAYSANSLNADPVPYAMVYLYEDLDGNVSLLSVADFDFDSFCTY